MKLVIDVPEGLGTWLLEQRNWLGLVLVAIVEYRQRHPELRSKK